MQDTLEKALGMDGKSLADIGEQHLERIQCKRSSLMMLGGIGEQM